DGARGRAAESKEPVRSQAFRRTRQTPMSTTNSIRPGEHAPLEPRPAADEVACRKTTATSHRPGLLLLGVLALGIVIVPDLWAGGTGTTMPWNTPMQTLLNNMTGPTARALVGIATAF